MDVMMVNLDFTNTSILQDMESIIILQNLCKDMIRLTKHVLVQMALAKLIPNQIQEGHFVSCNRSQHSIEYCNGYRAGEARQQGWNFADLASHLQLYNYFINHIL